MRYFIQPTGRRRLAGFIAIATLITVAVAAGSFISPARADESKPNLYVPYKDLAHLIAPADKAVLMDRAKFAKLLADAEANAALADTLELGQVKLAEYAAKVSGEELTLTGKLDVVSIGNGTVAVPLGFGGVGLTRVILDGNPAPLGYDKNGRLTLIVRTKGDHQLEITGTTKLKELASGGAQFSISLPQAVAGRVKLVAAGDLEIHATVPASATSYDKPTDTTSIQLTVGGMDKLAVVLLGNGRQEDDRAILLGDSAATVNLTRSHQVLSCLYTAQVLRRGVRQLQFQLPAQWTITEVSSPDLVKWSVDKAEQIKTLSVRLRSGKVGTAAVHIKATAVRTSQTWDAPRIDLVDAAFQRGFMMVNTDDALGVRGEKVVAARREDALAAGSVPGLLAGATGPLYFHWGDKWSVNLELADVEPRRSIKERQKIVVSPQQVTLTGDFEVTAVERELFNLSFVLRGSASQWQLRTVLIDNKQTGFEYRIEEKPPLRLLKIELPRPIQPEKTANVTIVTQHVPADWLWPSDAPDRSITAPLIESQAETVSGHVSLWAEGDLDAVPKDVPEQLEPVPVGRMASLGMTGAVQHAYSHNKPVTGDIQLLVSRRRPRTSADAIGLISVRPREFSADWRITYNISRASAKRLYLLVDKSLGREFNIASATVPINSKSIVTPDDKSIPLSPELANRYNLWLLNLDHPSLGNVVIDIRYDRPSAGDALEVPLVRPICRDRGRISEQLAIQASEELALKADAGGAKEIDAVDLPPLPAQAARILWAFRLDAPATPDGAKTALTLDTDVHENYEIPSALAISAHLTTYLDTEGGQRSEAAFTIANAGRQFLTMRLPQGAELWSLRVGDRQVKPQRSADGDYQVSLGRLGQPVQVKIVYSYRPPKSGLERLDLGAILLPGVEINQMNWTVVAPPGYRITAQHSKMITHDLPRPTPAYLKLYDLLTENVFAGPPLLMALSSDAKRGAADMAARYRYEAEQVGAEDAEMPAREQKREPQPPQEAYGRRVAADSQPQAIPAKPPTEAESREEFATPPWAGQAQAGKPVAPWNSGAILLAEGRSTLPVDLVPTAGAGSPASFAGLGTAELTIGLTRTAWMSSCWAVGFAMIAVIGIALLRTANRGPKAKAKLIVAILSLASLLALWRPAMVYFANGAFAAGLCLIPLYVFAAFVRLLWSKLRQAAATNSVSAASVALLVCILSFACSAQAAVPANQQAKETRQPIEIKQSESIIIPYDQDPTAAENSNKVLIPYARFIKLWNQAHPDDIIEQLPPAMEVSLAAVRYEVRVESEILNLLLTADIRTYGPDWVVLPMPISGLAVVEATIDGKPAQFHSPPQPKGKTVAPNIMVLMLPGKTSGQLRLKAVAKPKNFGRRGTAEFSLPPLPGAVMEVILPAEDLELEVEGLESAPSPQKTNGKTKWTLPLGMTRQLTLNWLPKAGGGAADSTLSAASAHDVYAFHWAIVGVSKIAYTFSGGEHDRFALLTPKGTILTEVKGTNIRDYRPLGERTIDGKPFDLIEVRLHRPAKKQYDLTVRWLGELPPPDEPVQLLLVRAADVTRESGAVTLHSAGGMAVKVAKVAGGRRTAVAAAKDSRAAELTADKARPVAGYYWPYRPFELFVQFSRLDLSPQVRLDQLVRISTDRTELLVQADLTTEQGKLFGASFILPAGYELLSVVGPAVENFYERSAENRNYLHVKFDRGRKDAKTAMVLVRRNAPARAFDVPMITYIDSAAPAPKQQGRLAVQVVASLEAKTAASSNLKPLVPGTLKDWLDAGQINSVQFAYSYELADPSLKLDISHEPTRIRVEAFAALAVKTTAAVYTYRLRYNITGSPIDNLSFSLPDAYAPLVAVNSPAMRSAAKSQAAGRTTWKVVLVNEVTGEVDIAVNFALPIDAATKLLSIPRIQTDAPAGYRAIIAVQNLSRHDINIKAENKTNLAELAVSEQRKLMSRQMTESLQYVFQSFEDNWSLSLDFTPAKTAARIQAVVDLLALTTVIDRNGRCRYQARIALQNRSEQFLTVNVPAGLRLWSATVASQPVKPVTAAEQGRVLIPLVKTSPGGLPYDVDLYFADEQTKPLVQPLNGITNLKPPAVSIHKIPVMQTTWSLRLPAGYRYIRPGGNLSPVAGTVEILSLNIKARLEQLKRLDKTYRDVSGSSSRTEVIARDNWDLFNTKIATDIKEAQIFLESNRGQVSDDDYKRLHSKLGGQKQFQATLIGGNSAVIREQENQAQYDLNAYINTTAVNPGLAESVRNDAFQQKPDFIRQGEQQQIERLTKELEVSQKRLKAIQQKTDKAATDDMVLLDADADAIGAQTLLGDLGQKPTSLILAPSDKKAETRGILTELSEQSAAQIGRQQIQIRNQLEELTDNRSQRHFQGGLGQQTAQTLEPQFQAKGKSPASAQRPATSSRTTAAGDILVMNGSDARAGGSARTSQPQPAAESSPAGPQNRAFALDLNAFAQESSISAGSQYVAKGTYSLPVTLPQGEVRLDFARSAAGNAQLNIWAVPQTTIKNLQATAAVVAALLLALGIIKIWPTTQPPISPIRAIIYLALFLTSIATLGLLGLAIATTIILAAEAIRAKSKQKQATAHG